MSVHIDRSCVRLLCSDGGPNTNPANRQHGGPVR
jgi:hypothetical protein